MEFTSTPLHPILTEPEFSDLLERYRRENWQGIQTPEWQERIVTGTLRDTGEAIFEQLAQVWRVPEQATVLDIGSGVGTFVLACRRRGLAAFGIEPDRIGRGGELTSIQIARRRIQDQVFAVALGESLPFRDRSFDLITMDQVMEHVSDQQNVLREAAQVLKPGGAIYISSPNYLRFYESHYKIFWMPLLPKILGRLYLKSRGRNPVLLDQLTYTTNARLRRIILQLGADYTTVDLHREQFLKKRKHGGFLSFRARCVNSAMRLPLVGRWITRAALLYLSWTEGGCQLIVLRKT